MTLEDIARAAQELAAVRDALKRAQEAHSVAIRAALTEHTHQEVADAAGLSRARVTQIAHGKR